MITEVTTIERDRDLISGSTKTRALFSTFEWLIKMNHINIIGRVSKGPSHKYIKAKYSNCNEKIEHKKLVHLGSYNYSGLNGNSAVLENAMAALNEYGVTTSGVRLLNGTTELHIALEKKLATFLGFEDVVTYSSGFSANISTLSALCSDKDVVYSDELNHQSINDGLKLSGAQTIKFPHKDYETLRGMLKGSSKVQRKFIITDGIFSMDGDVADLKKIVNLANEYNTFVIVDDAHATASYGPNGRGTPAHFRLESEIDVLTGSLSKGLPGIGGFAAGSKKTIDLLRYGSNGYIFSASLPPATLGGLIAAIDILEKHPEIQEQLHRNETLLRDGIRTLGLDVMHSESAVIPILLPNRDITFKFAKELHEEGVYANPVIFPAVSKRLPRIRLNASAVHEIMEIEYALDAIKNVAKKLQLI